MQIKFKFNNIWHHPLDLCKNQTGNLDIKDQFQQRYLCVTSFIGCYET